MSDDVTEITCDGCTGASDWYCVKCWNGLVKELHDAEVQRDALRAEVEVLRGVGCRETKEGEPESGPCGVCLRCAEERGERRAQAEVERMSRLLDHATQSNPGTSVLVMLMDESARLRERITSMQESMSMACEEPPTGCGCAGCSYSREKGGDA